MYRTLSALAALAMAAGTVAFAAPARAASLEDSVTVSLDGLDLADPADARRLDRRIRSAARDLCGSQALQPVRLMQQAVACEKAAVAQAHGAVEMAAAKRAAPFLLTLRSN
jgi:UrcA family protein